MPVSNAFLEMLHEVLAPLGRISARRMFGGASLYCDGLLFALIADDELFLKADETSKHRYEDEGMEPFTYEGKTGPVSMSYWRAPDRLFDDGDAMLEFVREALQAAARAAAAKRRSKAPRPQKMARKAQKAGKTTAKSRTNKNPRA